MSEFNNNIKASSDELESAERFRMRSRSDYEEFAEIFIGDFLDEHKECLQDRIWESRTFIDIFDDSFEFIEDNARLFRSIRHSKRVD